VYEATVRLHRTGSCCGKRTLEAWVCLQDPEAEKAALETAADQSLAELAASMGLTLAQLLGQEPPPAESKETDKVSSAAGPSKRRGVSPQGGSASAGERQGKRTRRMVAEEQAAAEAAKKATEGGIPDSSKAAGYSAGKGAAGYASVPEAGTEGEPETVACKIRAIKRARGTSIDGGSISRRADVDGSIPELLPGASSERKVPRTEADQCIDKEMLEGRSTRPAVKHGAQGKKLEEHDNDSEHGARVESEVEGAEEVENKELENIPEASEKEDEQVPVKASEVCTMSHHELMLIA
jgi:hypothetical protein